jgi:predicted RNase H-like HicB family nuclease
MAIELTANAFYAAGWYSVKIRELPGVFSQTRTLAEVPAVVRVAAADVTGRSPESFTVTVRDQT